MTTARQEWESPWERWYAAMRARMFVSGHKYGPLSASYPDKVDALKCLEERLALYRQTHNVEWLVDAANFALIEATCPRYPDAHFKATDSTESPGLANRDGSREHGAASQSAVARIRALRE